MKIFIGQRVSDENWNELLSDTKKINSSLIKAGYTVYSTMDMAEDAFDKSSEWLFHAFKEIDKSDAFLAIVKSEKWSEGLLIEIGYVLAKNKKLILAIKKEVKNTYLREMTDNVIEFENINDLIKQLENLNI